MSFLALALVLLQALPTSADPSPEEATQSSSRVADPSPEEPTQSSSRVFLGPISDNILSLLQGERLQGVKSELQLINTLSRGLSRSVSFLRPSPGSRSAKIVEWRQARTRDPTAVQKDLLQDLFTTTIFAETLPEELVQWSWEEKVFKLAREANSFGLGNGGDEGIIPLVPLGETETIRRDSSSVAPAPEPCQEIFPNGSTGWSTPRLDRLPVVRDLRVGFFGVPINRSRWAGQ